MARSATEQSQSEEAQAPRTQTRTSLSGEDDDFDFQYFESEYVRDPWRLFNSILRALKQRDTLQEENQDQGEQITELAQELSEVKEKLV